MNFSKMVARKMKLLTIILILEVTRPTTQKKIQEST